MINKLFISIFFLFLVLPFCSSLQVEMNSSYDLGGNFVVKLSGNFLESISKQDISFYRGHLPTVIESYLIKIDSEYYIYAQIPSEKIPDNYSMVVEGVKYLQGTQIKEETLTLNFSITNKTADFFVKPPALVSNTDFVLLLQNLQDKPLSIVISLSNKTESSGGFFSFFSEDDSRELYNFSLKSGETKNVNFALKDFNDGINSIKISSEDLDFFVMAKIIKEKEKPNFSFGEAEINISFITNSTKLKNISISNLGEKSIKNISFSLSSSLKDYVNLSRNLIEELKANSSEQITLNFFSNEEIYLEGFLQAEQEDNIRFLSISFSSFKDYIPIKENDSDGNEIVFESPTKTCSELNGTVCEEGFNCTGTLGKARDNRCCIGECNKVESSLTRRVIGWSLLTIGIAVLYIFLIKKYRGSRNNLTLPTYIKRS
ncbi:MAG: hypothetical protein ABIH28_03390 [archaeon]